MQEARDLIRELFEETMRAVSAGDIAEADVEITDAASGQEARITLRREPFRVEGVEDEEG